MNQDSRFKKIGTVLERDENYVSDAADYLRKTL